ncbi:winged helix-turn-helix domain-containing protein [Halorussus salinisoli]|uniref:winged helix-turn-helix domain-containing protein n=1 Tax=Halorussus salinisoli TaxID=2558242 RepID=UPI0010C20248|nr:winged helix-turn-helix domain-containing protein [Halorussus salinisoli]
MAEFSTDVSLEDVAVRDPRISSAVDEPVRAMILDMLAERDMTIRQVHSELADRGYDRTENTVRHHVNELRDVGLVEVTQLEERRGGTTKYYRANTILLSYSVPEEHEAAVDEMVDRIQPDVAELVAVLEDEFGETLRAISGEMSPCEHCRTQKYETFLLLTVLRRAFVRAHARDVLGGDE